MHPSRRHSSYTPGVSAGHAQESILSTDSDQNAEHALPVIGVSVPVLLETFPTLPETHVYVAGVGGRSLGVSDLAGRHYQQGTHNS